MARVCRQTISTARSRWPRHRTQRSQALGLGLCFVARVADGLQVCVFVGAAACFVDDVVNSTGSGDAPGLLAGLAQATVTQHDAVAQLVPLAPIATLMA